MHLYTGIYQIYTWYIHWIVFKEVYSSFYSSEFIYTRAIIGDPRVYGLEFGYLFTTDNFSFNTSITGLCGL